MKTKPKPAKTRQDFLKELADSDMTVIDWARENDFPVGAVYMACQGRTSGKRGMARAIARAMGLSLPAMGAPASRATPNKKQPAASRAVAKAG